jgi:hypothetical protein
MTSNSVRALHRQLFSRRAFLQRTWSLGGLLASAAFFEGKIQAASSAEIPYLVMGVIGDLVIPVDEDPGYNTFEPGISQYAVDAFMKHVVLAGDQSGFDALLGAMHTMNEAPPILDFAPKFLDMPPAQQAEFFKNCITGQYENDGYGDVLGLTSFIGLFAAKAVFFSNYPRHLATPGADIQVIPPSSVKTGFDIMGFGGPISAAEEASLRAKYFDVEVEVGIDRSNKLL